MSLTSLSQKLVESSESKEELELSDHEDENETTTKIKPSKKISQKIGKTKKYDLTRFFKIPLTFSKRS